MKEKREKKTGGLMPLLILALVAALLVVTVLAVVFGKDHKTAGNQGDGQDQTTEKWQEGIISYNGKYYRYNNRIKSYLFLGIDKSGTMAEAMESSEGNAGQSDVMFLLVQDKKNKTLSAIAINRNTMAEIDTYDINNKPNGTTTAQICLQHTYGDGGRLSCQYTVESVERLFNNIPISGYYAMTMDGIPVLNDALGGIEVKVMDDLSDDSMGVQLKAGETRKLNGQEAYVYIRSRDVDEFNSATRRLERQKQYIEAMMERARQITQESKSSAVKVYDQLQDYSVTNMVLGDLAAELVDYTYSGEMYSLPGEMVQGELFEEYYLDDEAMYELILSIFYEEVSEEEAKKVNSAGNDNKIQESVQTDKIAYSDEVEEKLASMTTEEKAAQLFLVTPETLTNNAKVSVAGPGCQTAIGNIPVGGIFCSRSNFLGLDSTPENLEKLQTYSRDRIGVDLFLFAERPGVENDTTTKTDYMKSVGLNSILLPSADNQEIIAEYSNHDITVILPFDQAQSPSDSIVRAVSVNEMVTDGINIGDACVKALQDGCDMIYVTSDFETAYQAVVAAIKDGTLSENLVHNAAGKILTIKLVP